MEQVVLPVDHRVLVWAELLDPLGKESVGGLFRLAAGDGPAEGLEAAEMIAEFLLDQGDAFLRNLVGFEQRALRSLQSFLGDLRFSLS